MMMLDRTHNPEARSWIPSAAGHPDFPVQNLPLGIVSYAGRDVLATIVGEEILPFTAAMGQGWGAGLGPELRQALGAHTLNPLAALPPIEWSILRHALFEGFTEPHNEQKLRTVMVPRDRLVSRLPFAIGDYSDFYASIHHATNVGSMFRPDQPLLPNYKWVPIGYHGRVSSIVLDGEPVRRPSGQTKGPDAAEPSVGPSRLLDYELELGFFIGGRNPMGEAVSADEASERVFGCVLLNDWSARDLQAWEYQPLGPFLAKNFATTISPWVITTDALRPFRVPMTPRPEGDPAPLPYLRTTQPDWSYRIALQAGIRSEAMRRRDQEPAVIARVDFEDAMYWSPTQLVAHHASSGCNLRPGDLLGSGTISGTTPESRGCLLERTWRGRDPVTVGRETRTFLQDGDEVSLRGTCHAPGAVSIGFGGCRGVILPA